MRKNIDSTTVANLARFLENHELGAAVRILAEILERGSPLSVRRVKTISRLDDQAWDASGQDILSVFSVSEDDMVFHPLLDEQNRPDLEVKSTPRKGKQFELDMLPATRSAGQTPEVKDEGSARRLSIKKIAFDAAIEIFAQAGKDENYARTYVGSLLGHWSQGQVYEAIEAAYKQDYIINPAAWIRSYLNRNAAPRTSERWGGAGAVPAPGSAVTPVGKTRVATPERMRISEGTQRQLADAKGRLRLDLSSTKVEAIQGGEQ